MLAESSLDWLRLFPDYLWLLVKTEEFSNETGLNWFEQLVKVMVSPEFLSINFTIE